MSSKTAAYCKARAKIPLDVMDKINAHLINRMRSQIPQDLGVRRGFQIAHGKRKIPEPEWLARHGERWAPHRTAAARYLWRAADFRGDGAW